MKGPTNGPRVRFSCGSRVRLGERGAVGSPSTGTKVWVGGGLDPSNGEDWRGVRGSGPFQGTQGPDENDDLGLGFASDPQRTV